MREDRQLPRLAQAIKEMEEAMIVVTYQHAQLAKNHKSAVEWLESHNKAMLEMRKSQKATDVRIEKLVSAIGDLLRTRSQ